MTRLVWHLTYYRPLGQDNYHPNTNILIELIENNEIHRATLRIVLESLSNSHIRVVEHWSVWGTVIYRFFLLKRNVRIAGRNMVCYATLIHKRSYYVFFSASYGLHFNRKAKTGRETHQVRGIIERKKERAWRCDIQDHDVGHVE